MNRQILFKDKVTRVILFVDAINYSTHLNTLGDEKINLTSNEHFRIIENNILDFSGTLLDKPELCGDCFRAVFHEKNAINVYKLVEKSLIDITKINAMRESPFRINFRFAIHSDRFSFETSATPLTLITRLLTAADYNKIIMSENYFDLIKDDIDTNAYKQSQPFKGIGETEYYESIIETDIVKQIKDSSSNPTTIPINLNIHSKLPQRDIHFVGRHTQLESFIETILENRLVAVLSGVVGMGGVGKSAIVKEVCHIFKSGLRPEQKKSVKLRKLLDGKKYFKDGILWIKFDKDVDYNNSLEDVTNQLGVKINADENFRVKLKELLFDKEILVVLDSAEQNEDSYKEYVQLFAEYPKIVTSRKRFDFPRVLNMPVMSVDESYELFTEVAQRTPTENEKKEILNLLEMIGYLPLAVRILAKRYKSNISISRIIKEFKLSKSKITELREELHESSEYNNVDAYAVFSLSYNTLLETQKLLFIKASVFNYPFTLNALKDIAKNENIENDLKSLIEYSMIDTDSFLDEQSGISEDIYSLHPLMREFALEKLQDKNLKNELKEARVRHFLELAKGQKRLFLELDELFDVMREQLELKEYEKYLEFALHMDKWLSEYQFLISKVDVDKRAIEVCKLLKKEKEENGFLFSLADTMIRQGKFSDAEVLYKKCLPFYKNNKNIDNVLWIHYMLPAIKSRNKDYSTAYIMNSKYFFQSLSFNELITGSGFSRSIGDLHLSYSLFDPALQCYLSNIQNKENRDNLILGILDILFLLKDMQGYSQEIEKQYLLLLENTRHPANVQIILHSLFNIYIDKNDLEKAKKTLLNWQNISERLGNVETISTNQVMLADLFLLKKEYKKAIELYQKIDDQDGKNFLLGKAYLEKKDYNKAIEHLEKRASYNEDLGYMTGLAENNILLARCYIETNKEKAVEYLMVAVNTLKHYDINLIPEYKEIEEYILNTLSPKEAIDYNNKYANKILITDKANFLNPKLDREYIAKDGKKMILIPQGLSFFGEGNRIQYEIQDILENIDKILDGSFFSDNAKQLFLYNYYIDETLVTNKEFLSFCDATGYPMPKHLVDKKIDNIANQPIVNITLQDAKEYANWAEKRLALPQEYEKAVRGESGKFYSWGDTINKNKIEELYRSRNEQYETFKWYLDLTIVKIENIEQFTKEIFGEEKYNLFNKALEQYPNFYTSTKEQQLTITENIIKMFPPNIQRLKDASLINNTKHSFDEIWFLKLLVNSISISQAEKENILNNFSKLSKEQIDGLISIFLQELITFYQLDEKHYNQLVVIHKNHQYDWIEFLKKRFNISLISDVKAYETDKSDYGVYDLTLNVQEMTLNTAVEEESINTEELPSTLYTDSINSTNISKNYNLFRNYIKLTTTHEYEEEKFLHWLLGIEKFKILQEVKNRYSEDELNDEKKKKEIISNVISSFQSTFSELDDQYLLPKVNFQFDKILFLKLLAQSVSLDIDYKTKILENFLTLTKDTIEDLMNIFLEEVIKFDLLRNTKDKKYLEVLRKNKQIDFIKMLMNKFEITMEEIHSIENKPESKSIYKDIITIQGVDIFNVTTEKKISDEGYKSMNLGFRCVKTLEF